MIAVVNGMRHVLYFGVGVADSTACGLLVAEDAERRAGEPDCMACVAGPVRFHAQALMFKHLTVRQGKRQP